MRPYVHICASERSIQWGRMRCCVALAQTHAQHDPGPCNRIEYSWSFHFIIVIPRQRARDTTEQLYLADADYQRSESRTSTHTYVRLYTYIHTHGTRVFGVGVRARVWVDRSEHVPHYKQLHTHAHITSRLLVAAAHKNASVRRRMIATRLDCRHSALQPAQKHPGHRTTNSE